MHGIIFNISDLEPGFCPLIFGLFFDRLENHKRQHKSQKFQEIYFVCCTVNIQSYGDDENNIYQYYMIKETTEQQ